MTSRSSSPETGPVRNRNDGTRPGAGAPLAFFRVNKGKFHFSGRGRAEKLWKTPRAVPTPAEAGRATSGLSRKYLRDNDLWNKVPRRPNRLPGSGSEKWAAPCTAFPHRDGAVSTQRFRRPLAAIGVGRM